MEQYDKDEIYQIEEFEKDVLSKWTSVRSNLTQDGNIKYYVGQDFIVLDEPIYIFGRCIYEVFPISEFQF